MERVKLGFLVCASAVPVLFTLIGAAVFGLLVLVITGSATACAIPLFIWFRRRRWLTLVHGVVGGTLIGGVVALFFVLISGTVGSLSFLATFYGGMGALHGALFWLVAICRNDALFVGSEAAKEPA